MKKLLLLLSAFAFLFGCSKNDDTINNTSLIGKWEYRGMSCYCAPLKDSSTVKPGNGNMITFTATTYKHFKKDSLIKSGTYRTRRYDNARKQIIYDNDTSSTNIIFVRIEKKILTFYGAVPLAADGPEYHYEKQ